MSIRYWWLTKDGDADCLRLYERHYSCYRYADGRIRKLFVGPGEKVVLRTEHGDAMFVWRKFIDDSGQQGINCAVFRNESPIRSSDLIRQADEIADCLWPNSRHYTYVDSTRVASKNPGFCFLQAGWQKCGRTKRGLLVMERIAPDKVDEITTLRALRADHAAFVAQVREVAEGMECARDCESTLKAWETNLARCTCPRGKLLALCEVD